ncbi:MAG: radical SAM protein [Holophagales bacterium]|nr:radical SAM protein [Holophagales bacterium]
MSHATPCPSQRRHIELGLMLAHTCNITCRHCGILSSPHNKNRMPFDAARDYIRQAGALEPLVQAMIFTGGEPFLFVEEHLQLVEQCRAAGLGSRMVSNGFWARNPDQGRRLLQRFRDAGLREMNLSADRWHLEFLPARILRNAIRCLQEVGYVAIVSFAHNTSGDMRKAFCELYGWPEERTRYLVPDELRQMSRHPADHPALGSDVFLHGGRIIGMGRAAEHPDELIMSDAESFERGPCNEVANRPVIYPDGDLVACCCAGGKVDAFVVGNLHTEPLADLLDRMLSRTQFQFINHIGPRDMYDAVVEARPDIPRRGQYSSICELCVRSNDALDASAMDSILSHEVIGRMVAGLASGPAETSETETIETEASTTEV